MRTNRVKVNEKIVYDLGLCGSFCFLHRDKDLIKRITDRENVALKIFFRPLSENELLTEYLWGHYFHIKSGDVVRHEAGWFSDVMIIQNLCAFEGLAPRVYGFGTIEYVGRRFPFQLVEDLTGAVYCDEVLAREVCDKVDSLGEELGFSSIYKDYIDNVIDGKLIDFQNFALDGDYFGNARKRIEENATWSGNFYPGYRGGDRRLKLDSRLFKGKRVLDIGCNVGEFSMFASRSGANRVIGVDKPEIVKYARELANIGLDFDVDFIGADLRNWKPGEEFDVALFMSMIMHVGFPEYLLKIPTVIYEHNGDTDVKLILDKFLVKGYTVKDLGITGTGDDRRLYIFQK